MSTTTVKGAGRARFERNKKHQQRTPLPPRGSDAIKTAREAVAAAAQEVVSDRKEARAKSAEAKPERVTKAQQLALAAEEAGWDVTRKVDGDTKVLTATRGEEKLVATWINDKSAVPLGHHTVGSHTAKFQHVTVALKIIATDPEVAATNAATATTARRQPKSVTHKTLSQGVSFNAATATDEEVLEAVRARELFWTNIMSGGELKGQAIVPYNGKQTKIVQDDLTDLTTRQLTFCDAAGSGYYTVRLSQLTGVGAEKDALGHLMTNTQHDALVAMKEGRK